MMMMMMMVMMMMVSKGQKFVDGMLRKGHRTDMMTCDCLDSRLRDYEDNEDPLHCPQS